jgi:dihydrofolate reductase
MRKIIVALAVSADGFIARKDGSFDWLDRPEGEDGLDMEAFVASIDTIIWGRKTYDQALAMGHDPSFGPKIRHVVLTHRPAEPRANFEFTSEAPAAVAAKLRAEPGKDIWIMGGGGVVAGFLDAGAIDEFSLHVIPTLIGEGIPLIAPAQRTVPLELLTAKAYGDGTLHIRYRALNRA